MRIELTPHEARVIGSLIEKEIITPDHYPLSLSALTSACNQKSSRDPVMQLSETEVQELLDGLKKKHLVSDRAGFGHRVAKYQHRFCNTGFGSLEFSSQELGILCLLLLRGAQTPGELRSRTSRLCELADVQETESVLDHLMQREDGPFVRRLVREAGRRESRFVHLFCEQDDEVLEQALPVTGPECPAGDDRSRMVRLEEQVRTMRIELDELKRKVDRL